MFFIKLSQPQGSTKSGEQAAYVDDAAIGGGDEAVKGNDHDGGSHDDTDDPVKGKGILFFKQGINGFGQDDNGGKCAKSAGNQD